MPLSWLDSMIEVLFARLGEQGAIMLAGGLIGVAFGFFAQRSRFCLRSAAIEFARNTREGKLTTWLFAFSTAVIFTQVFVLLGWLNVSDARQLTARGSLSGAAIGGAMFGTGMILARGCSSRLLVLAAQGNLRALLSGLVFAVTAQSALGGALSPVRQWLAELWTIPGPSRDILAQTGIGHVGALLFGLVWFVGAIVWSYRQRASRLGAVGAAGVGMCVALAWLVTFRVGKTAFDTVVPVQALSFTGPAADTLMFVLSPPGQPWKFDLGLVPGVAIGSFIAAALFHELKLEGFQGGQAMKRYIAGALLMGFGGMLAGGCAVGAGVSGAAIFTITAWVALVAIWIAASLTDALIDRPVEGKREWARAQAGVVAGYAAP